MTVATRTEKLAVVTGTSAGIGAAVADALLADGWTVAGVARREVTRDDPAYTHWSADLADAAMLEDLVASRLRPRLAERSWRRVALVKNAARIGELGGVEDLSADGLAALLAVNVAAPLRLMGAVSAALPGGAALRVVNISSGAAYLPIPGLADYCASKAALHAAGRTAAAEWSAAGRDAAVFSYQPGIVETAMQVAARGADPARFPSQPAFAEFHASGALAAPSDVVGPIAAFVAGDPAEPFTEARYGAD